MRIEEEAPNPASGRERRAYGKGQDATHRSTPAGVTQGHFLFPGTPCCLLSQVPLVEQHPSPNERLECNPQCHFFPHPSHSTNSHPNSVTSNCPKWGLYRCQGIISTTVSAYFTLPWSNSLFRPWLPGWSLQHGNPAFSLSGAKLFNFHIILFFPNFYPPTEVAWANNECVWNTFSSSAKIWMLFLFIFMDI